MIFMLMYLQFWQWF